MKSTILTVVTERRDEENGFLTFMRYRPDPNAPGYVALYQSQFRHGRLSSSSMQVDLTPVANVSDDGRFVENENGRTPPIKILDREQNEELHWEGVNKAACLVYGATKRGKPMCSNSELRDLSDEIQKLLW